MDNSNFDLMKENEKKIDDGAVDFVHLHVHTEYSLLDGASRVKKLVSYAKELGMKSLAITDHGTMYGTIAFYKEAKKQGIKPIIGCEVYLAPKSRFDNFEVEGTRYYHLILLAENNTGYQNLIKLVSLANIEGMYYKPRVDKELLRRYHEGIICLSSCIAGEIPQAIIRDNMERAEKLVQEYAEIFGRDNFFLEIQNHQIPEEAKANAGLIKLAQKYGVKLVATNDIHYIKREDSTFHDVLLCIQTGRTIDDKDRMKFNNDDFYLKSGREMADLFAAVPQAITNTLEIAERCNVEFEFGHLHLPNFPLPEGMTDEQYLRKLCEEKISNRYSEITEEIQQRLEYELSIIHRMGYDSYFLIVWDFINFARSQNIAVGPGRGSAAGSIVAYILGITDIDPLKYNLLFERFLNPERVTMPDIDIDFCYIRRDEVIEYVKRRYGDDHVAQIITFGTMAAKGAIRDVGRVMNMSYGEVDKIAKLVPQELGITLDKALKDSAELREFYQENMQVRRLIDYARDIEGMPRHSSTHAAGVVISKEPVTDYVPIQLSEGTFVTQYDKDCVEELGLLKMDFLGLRTLTVIADTLENIKNNRGIIVDLDKIPLADEKTAAMLCRGETGAVFQMESAGMTTLVKDLQPHDFADLIPVMALYRPGPLGSGMVTDFINGRHGRKKVTYMHPALEPILKETFGVILYQEQVMQIVQVLAGFTLGQADILRRAMGKKKHDVLMSQKENFLQGTKANGIDEKLANTIFDLLLNFADYGFNKSHSAAYALVSWRTAYLKAHYPQEFMAAILTSLMTSTKIGEYIELCKHMGIQILPPDINASRDSFTVDGGSIRFGMAAVKSVGEAALKTIVKIREADGPFKSLEDFCARVSSRCINKRSLENLIKCGAFDSLGYNRAQYLAVLDQAMDWGSRRQKDIASGQMDLFGEFLEDENSLDKIDMPKIDEFPKMELLNMEKEITGFYITGHPLEEYRNKIEHLYKIEQLPEQQEGKYVTFAGIVRKAKRVTTKKGDMMCFLEVEDFAGVVEGTVFPKSFYENINYLVPDIPVVVRGRVNHIDDETKIIVDKVIGMEEYVPEFCLVLKPEQETPENFLKLKETLYEYAGNCPVYMYFLGTKKMIKGNREFWIDGSNKAFKALQKLLGKNSIKQR